MRKVLKKFETGLDQLIQREIDTQDKENKTESKGDVKAEERKVKREKEREAEIAWMKGEKKALLVELLVR